MTLDELRACATSVVRDGSDRRFVYPFGEMSVTLNEAELLAAIVRALNPRLVLEIGSGHGVSARFMAEALAPFGEVVTVEPHPWFRQCAEWLLEPCENATVVADVPRYSTPELVFIDSGYDRRVADLEHWLEDGDAGVVIFHDADRDYQLPPAARGVSLGTANGLWIGRP